MAQSEYMCRSHMCYPSATLQGKVARGHEVLSFVKPTAARHDQISLPLGLANASPCTPADTATFMHDRCGARMCPHTSVPIPKTPASRMAPSLRFSHATADVAIG